MSQAFINLTLLSTLSGIVCVVGGINIILNNFELTKFSVNCYKISIYADILGVGSYIFEKIFD